jgi:hypothetical protein
VREIIRTYFYYDPVFSGYVTEVAKIEHDPEDRDWLMNNPYPKVTVVSKKAKAG